MNPITIAGTIASAALLAYGAYACYSAGQNDRQADWDKAALAWQQEKSALQTKVTQSERDVVAAQKDAQNANVKAQIAAQAAIDANRARTAAVVARLQQHTDQLSKRLAASADDSAALTECKTAGRALQDVFGSCLTRHRELGDQATLDLAKSRGAGLECERSYDAAERALKKLGE